MADTPWSKTLDYDYPEMTTVDDGAWLPAFTAAIEVQIQRVEQIAADPDPVTVENTLHAFAQSGRELDRLQRAFGVMVAADGTPQRQQIRSALSGDLAAHRDAVTLHPGLMSRLRSVESAIEEGDLTATEEQQWFLRHLLLTAESSGAMLPSESRARLEALNRELAEQEAAYSALQVREAAEAAVWVQSRAAVKGLSAAQRDAAAQAASEAGCASGYLLRLSMPVQQPLLAQLTDRDTRAALHRASVSRGTLSGEDGRTTRQIGAEIAVLRASRAELLGFAHHMDAVLPLRSAPSTEAVTALIKQLTTGAVPRAEAECAQVAEHLGLSGELAAEDLHFGIERLRPRPEQNSSATEQGTQQRHSKNLPLSEALRRLFDAAGRVYGLSVVEREDLPGFVPTARCFEVFDGDPGEPGTGLGLYLLDVAGRPTKAGGAWMNAFSVPSHLAGTHAVVTNNQTVSPGSATEEPQLTPAEQKTLFHEFGHALHALVADVEFVQLSGTAVPRDVVEFPSQVNEVFRELWKGSEPHASPEQAQDALWGKGVSTVEHLAAVVIDIAWHTLSVDEALTAAEGPDEFEAQALRSWGLENSLVPPRYHGGFFKHIFAGSGYAAGYYSYLWAQVLAADVSAWFREVLGDADKLAARGQRFRAELLSRGNTRDPLVSYRRALGRDPRPEPLLESLGLSPSEQPVL